MSLALSLGASSGLTYYYGDGSYFSGSVDEEGRPKEGSFYGKEGYLRYNGSFVRGHYHGEGTWYGERGETYRGQFHDGVMEGIGVLINPVKKERMEGHFSGGLVDGEAIWYRPDEIKLEGVFRRGHAHGKGVVTWDKLGYRYCFYSKIPIHLFMQ